MLSPDGWTKNDLIYVWKQEGALQIANNLSLPGIVLRNYLIRIAGNTFVYIVSWASSGRK